MQIFPETETRFFFKDSDAQIEFVRDASDKVIKRKITIGEQTTEAMKVKQVFSLMFSFTQHGFVKCTDQDSRNKLSQIPA